MNINTTKVWNTGRVIYALTKGRCEHTHYEAVALSNQETEGYIRIYNVRVLLF